MKFVRLIDLYIGPRHPFHLDARGISSRAYSRHGICRRMDGLYHRQMGISSKIIARVSGMGPDDRNRLFFSGQRQRPVIFQKYQGLLRRLS